MKFLFNILLFNVVNISNTQSLYVMNIPQAKIRVENYFKVIIYENIFVKTNNTIWKVTKNADLAMSYYLKLKLVSNIVYSCFFLSLCGNFGVTIREVKTSHLIFNIKYGNHDLILGQYFIILVEFSPKYKFNHVFSNISHLHT